MSGCGCYRYFTGFPSGGGDSGGLPPFVSQSLIPAVDGAYDLGRITPPPALRWNAVHAYDGVFVTSFTVPFIQGTVPTGLTERELVVRANLVPSGNAQYDLGSQPFTWRTLYASTLVADAEAVSALTVETIQHPSPPSPVLIQSNLEPGPLPSPAIDMGRASNRFQAVYAGTVDAPTVVSADVTTDVLRSGAPITLTQGLLPTPTSTHDVGSPTQLFGAVYAVDTHTDTLQSIVSPTIQLNSSILPGAPDLELGTTDTPFFSVYATNGTFANLSFGSSEVSDLSVGTIGAIAPSTEFVARDTMVPQAPTATLGTLAAPFAIFGSTISADTAVSAPTVQANTVNTPTINGGFMDINADDLTIAISEAGRCLVTADAFAVGSDFMTLDGTTEVYMAAPNIILNTGNTDVGAVTFQVNTGEILKIDGQTQFGNFMRMYPLTPVSSLGTAPNPFTEANINEVYTTFIGSPVGQPLVTNGSFYSLNASATNGLATNRWSNVYATAVDVDGDIQATGNVEAGGDLVTASDLRARNIRPPDANTSIIGTSTNYYSDVFTATVRHPDGSINVSAENNVILRAGTDANDRIQFFHGTTLTGEMQNDRFDWNERLYLYDTGFMQSLVPQQNNAHFLGSTGLFWQATYSNSYPSGNLLVSGTDPLVDGNVAMTLLRAATVRANANVSWIDNLAAAATTASYTTNDPGELRTLVSLLASCVKQLDARVTALEAP